MSSKIRAPAKMDSSILPKERKKGSKRKIMNQPNGDPTITEFIGEHFQHCEERIIKLCRSATEEDPPLLFAWKNVHQFVASIATVHVDAQPPFELPPLPSVDQFKESLLNYIRAESGASPAIELAVLPCTIGQVCLAVSALSRLESNPWFQAISAANPVAVPLAAIVVPVPRSNTVTSAIRSPAGVAVLWG
eukprot:gene27682-33431_t